MITCITFDHGWDHVQGLGGLWVKNDGVQIIKTGCVHKRCGYFHNGAKLEVPFFKNNFAFRSFSVSFFFWSENGNDGFMWNGCPAASGSSLSIATDWNVLLMSMNDQRFTLSTPQIAVRTCNVSVVCYFITPVHRHGHMYVYKYIYMH